MIFIKKTLFLVVLILLFSSLPSFASSLVYDETFQIGNDEWVSSPLINFPPNKIILSYDGSNDGTIYIKFNYDNEILDGRFSNPVDSNGFVYEESHRNVVTDDVLNFIEFKYTGEMSNLNLKIYSDYVLSTPIVKIEDLTSTSVTLSFTSPNSVGYKINFDGNIETIYSDNITFSSLVPDTTYSFSVVSFDSFSNESFEREFTFTTNFDESSIIDSPLLFYDNLSSNSVRLYWDSVDNAAGYKLFLDDFEIADIQDTTYYVSDLEFATEYEFSIQSYDSDGNFSSKNKILITTLDHVIPKPENFQSEILDLSTMNLTWDSVDYQFFSNYLLYQDDVEIYSGEENYFTVFDLVYSDIYKFTLYTQDYDGNLSSPNVKYFSTDTDKNNVFILYQLITSSIEKLISKLFYSVKIIFSIFLVLILLVVGSFYLISLSKKSFRKNK